MTYKEKLLKEHPEAVDDFYFGGVNSCPYMWGYENERPCRGKDRVTYSDCEKCWNREIKNDLFGGEKIESTVQKL